MQIYYDTESAFLCFIPLTPEIKTIVSTHNLSVVNIWVPDTSWIQNSLWASVRNKNKCKMHEAEERVFVVVVNNVSLIV